MWELLKFVCPSWTILVCLTQLGLTETPKPVNLILNGSFERSKPDRSPLDWEVTPGCSIDTFICHSGGKSLKVYLPQTPQSQSAVAHQSFWNVREGETYTCSAWIKTEEVQRTADYGFAYLAIYQYDESNNLLAFKDFVQLTGTTDWQRATYTFEAAKNISWINVICGLYQACGTAWFDDIVLVEGSQALDFGQTREIITTFVREGKGNIAIFKDDIPVEGMASSPDYLKRILKETGYQVNFLDADDLSNSEKLNKSNFDIIVLPYGASFPVAARRSLAKFLRSGGDFISLGGYVFDNPIIKIDNKWMNIESLETRKLVLESDFEKIDETTGMPKGWKTNDKKFCFVDAFVSYQGERSLKVSAAGGVEVAQPEWYYELENLQPFQRMLLSGYIKTENIHGTHFAYFAIYHYDKEGKLVQFHDIVQLTGTNDWQEYSYLFSNPQTAAKLVIKCGLWQTYGSVWFDNIRLYTLPEEVRINTRKGDPQDGLIVSPDQIGVFDPSYILERVAYAKANPNQWIIDKDIEIKGALKGYAASAVLGYNNARWISLMNGYDRYGRLRGSIGAVVHNYSGSYKKSSWAFFGVTNYDLFPETDKRLGGPRGRRAEKGTSQRMRKAFLDLVNYLMTKTYLHNLETDYACYRQGEQVKISVELSNFGWRSQTLLVKFQVLDLKEKESFFTKTEKVALNPQETKEIFCIWQPNKFRLDFYKVKVFALKGTKIIDGMELGFVVWNEEVIKGGFALTYKNNYFHAKDKPIFLTGSDTYANMFWSAQHNPLTWQRDVQRAQDFGLNVFENLQPIPAAPTYQPEEKLLRQFDGLIQICQKHKQIYFPCLLVGNNVVVSDEDLRAQKNYCTEYAKRYAKVPGLIYYLNGDFRLNLSNHPDIKKLFNQFLKEKYQTTENLRAAWHLNLPDKEIGDIDVEDLPSRGWGDVRFFDMNLFKVELLKRWLWALSEGIRSVDKEHPITAEFYSRPWNGIDLVAGSDGLDVGNIGYFDVPKQDLKLFPRVFKFIDMRAVGKSLNVGEFGVKTHPAWEVESGGRGYHICRTKEEQHILFLGLSHYALGLGGSKIQNWCWRDADENIFPWGLNYPCDAVPKDVLYLYRNISLFFRPFDLKYEPPKVYFLIADNHRLGGMQWQVLEALYRSVQMLISTHTDFGVINEYNLDKLPKEAKVLIYPLPFCPSDETYGRVKRFVEDGGILYVSGDISYDPERKRTKLGRLAELLGVEFVGENYPNIAYGDENCKIIRPREGFYQFSPYRGFPCIEIKPITAKVVAEDEKGRTVMTINQLGKGKVLYTTDIPEYILKESDLSVGVNLYKAFLEFAGVEREQIEPDTPDIHIFKLPTKKAETIWVLFNASDEAKEVKVPVTGGSVRLHLAKTKPGLILQSEGKLKALEAQGKVQIGDRTVVDANLHFMLTALDNQDIFNSKALLFMPLESGQFQLSTRAGWKNPVVELGDIKESQWIKLESIRSDVSAGMLKIKIDNDQALNLCLIVEKGEENKSVDLLRSWLTYPETISLSRSGHL